MNKKILDIDKTVYELCSGDPEIVHILAEIGFNDITKPGMLKTAGRIMTLSKGAALKGISLEAVKKSFEQHGYTIIFGRKSNE